jgi:hypothetical protein
VNVHWEPQELCRDAASYRSRHRTQEMEKRAHTLPTGEHPCRRQAQLSGLCPPTPTPQSLLVRNVLQGIRCSSIRWLFMVSRLILMSVVREDGAYLGPSFSGGVIFSRDYLTDPCVDQKLGSKRNKKTSRWLGVDTMDAKRSGNAFWLLRCDFGGEVVCAPPRKSSAPGPLGVTPLALC